MSDASTIAARERREAIHSQPARNARKNASATDARAAADVIAAEGPHTATSACMIHVGSGGCFQYPHSTAYDHASCSAPSSRGVSKASAKAPPHNATWARHQAAAAARTCRSVMRSAQPAALAEVPHGHE